LSGVFHYYGFDCRELRPASPWAPNLTSFVQLTSISDHEGTARLRLSGAILTGLSVNVTAMFARSQLYLALRSKVKIAIANHPVSSTWHAGCSTGEEVYSPGDPVQEEVVYHR